MVLYCVQFDRQLAAGGPVHFAGAIGTALAQDGPLNGAIGTPHTETAIRAFLADVRALLVPTAP